MALSQNTLVTFQFYLLKRIVIKQVSNLFFKNQIQTKQNSTLTLISSRKRNKSENQYILLSKLDFLEKYIIGIGEALVKSNYEAMLSHPKGFCSKFYSFHYNDGKQYQIRNRM